MKSETRSAAVGAVAAQDAGRARFEAWWKSQGFCQAQAQNVGKPHAWQAWQAALSSQQAPGGWRAIDQRTTEDCERCCYAMVLGLDYEQVPDFFGIFKTTRRDERNKWLAERGLAKVTLDMKNSQHPAPNGPLCIAGVVSPTGHPDGHAVVAQMVNNIYQIVYDPHPQRDKSGTVPFDATYFVPLPQPPSVGDVAEQRALLAQRLAGRKPLPDAEEPGAPHLSEDE